MGFFSHFCFARPGWLLLFLPAFLLLFLRRSRGSAESVRFSSLSILSSLGTRSRPLPWNFGLPLGYTALFLTILTLARPVWRDESTRRSASGIDIMIALDVSLSMDIDDFLIGDQPVRRIDVAKAVVEDFVNRRPNDRIGLVAFAGRPSSISPITLDHHWLLDQLERVQLNDFTDDQGTAIGSAIAASSLRLDARDAKSKIIVLITDGANNSGRLSPVGAAEQAHQLGVKIYTIAIGTEDGRVNGSIQRFPHQEFDLPTLRKISSITGAEHFRAEDVPKLRNSFQSIDRLEKSDSLAHPVREDTEWFPWFAAAAALATLGAALAASVHVP